MKVRISQAISMITKLIRAGLVPMMKGSPGMGKSAIVYQIAKTHNLKVIDLRLSQCDPTDLLGFPTILGDKAGYKPMETFPIVGDAFPINPETKEPYAGWILFLDEFNSASNAVQAAAYKITLDRMVGVHHLHKNCAVVCAGNMETDGAIVNSMSTAMQSRLVHFELVVDTKEWTDWAYDAGIDHRITDYMKFKPGALYLFQPDHTDDTFACSRTWEFVHKVLKVSDIGEKDTLELIAGAVSEGVAREFITFCKIYDSLPKIPAIMASPETAKMPDEPSILFALTGTISHNANAENIGQLMKYVSRMPTEFQVVTMRETTRRNREILAAPAVQKWVSASAAALF